MWDFVFRIGIFIVLCFGAVVIGDSAMCRKWKRNRTAKRVLQASGLDYRAERRRDLKEFWKK